MTLTDNTQQGAPTDNSGASFWNGILRVHADANTVADRVTKAVTPRDAAKAAELLEALEEQVAECFDEACEMCARHEALIAKARGQS